MAKNLHNKFSSKASLGLDISDESMKFVELINTKKGIRVGKHGEIKIEPGIVEYGKIKDLKRMEEILSDFLKKKKLKSLRVSLPEEQIYIFRLKLKKTGLKNIIKDIGLYLGKYMPISVDDVIFDYIVLKENNISLEIQVTVVPKNVIKNYFSVFKNSRTSVSSFELEAQAIARAVIKKNDLETHMIVDFGHKRTGISIISDGKVVFSSPLDFGGEMLTSLIQTKLGVSHEDAEKMKLEYYFRHNEPNDDFSLEFLGAMSVLKEEILKHFLAWQTQKDSDGKKNSLIKKIILCGGSSNLQGFLDYLAVSIKNPIEMANVWVNIFDIEKDIPEISFDKSLSFATAIGLALGDILD